MLVFIQELSAPLSHMVSFDTTTDENNFFLFFYLKHPLMLPGMSLSQPLLALGS